MVQSKALDYIIAFVHLGLLIAVFVYALYMLFSGNIGRGILLLILLGAYYQFALREAVKKEISRRKASKTSKN